MKKGKYVLVVLCTFCGALVMAFVVNILFKIKSNGVFSAEWTAGDALSYVASIFGAISTFVLGLVAYNQNERLQRMEDNNYIASNSCMVLVEEICIKPNVYVPVNYSLHGEQILVEKRNMTDLPSGYKIYVKLKKVDGPSQATPSLIYVSKCTMFVGDKKEKTMMSYIFTESVREGFTRVAIYKEEMTFSCTLLIAKDKQEEFEKAIKMKRNIITAEIEFEIITDKYVMTKCKCRACCEYQSSNEDITWQSKKPMVFFYGHELKKKGEIHVVGEELAEHN